MKLFNKTPEKVELTEKNAPKKKQIQFEIKSNILLKAGADTYSGYSDVRLCLNESSKFLLTNTDSSKEQIKEEIASKLEQLFEEICIGIDADETNFSNEFWYNLELEKSKETN